MIKSSFIYLSPRSFKGDGTSGQIGHYGVNDAGAGSIIYAMSPDEISSYGKQLIRNTGCDTMLLWEFDGDEEWYDGTIGGEYFQSDEDYLDATHDLVDCDHGWFGCPGRFGGRFWQIGRAHV